MNPIFHSVSYRFDGIQSFWGNRLDISCMFGTCLCLGKEGEHHGVRQKVVYQASCMSQNLSEYKHNDKLDEIEFLNLVSD